MSNRIKTIITILLLLGSLFFPLVGLFGLVAMWFWTKWPRWVKIILTIPLALVLIGLLFGLSYLFIWRPYKMSGDTMLPSLNNGEYLATKVVKDSTKIERGDIIIFRNLTDPNQDFIKRVIGLSGERISIQNGYVYINENMLDESKYLASNTLTSNGPFITEGDKYIIPQDEYFVLGDNRSKSKDSREWGFVKRSSIISKFWFCYLNCPK